MSAGKNTDSVKIRRAKSFTQVELMRFFHVPLNPERSKYLHFKLKMTNFSLSKKKKEVEFKEKARRDLLK